MTTATARAKWSTLIDRLVANTDVGKLKWKTSPDEDTIHVKVGDNHVGIFRARNRSNSEEFDFVVEIFSSDGRVVDRFSDEMVDGSYPKLRELYLLAFRQANGSDAVLDEILNALPDPDDIPF